MKKVIRLLVICVLMSALGLSLSGCSSSVGTGGKAEVVSDEKATTAKKDSSKKDSTEGQEEKTSPAETQGPEETTASQGGYGEPSGEPQTEAYAYQIYVTVDAGAYGGVMALTTLGYSYQPTALDVLKDTGVSVDITGDYVSGINGLYEFDNGPSSGWLYQVNGETPGISSASYRLNSGDSVYWYYQAE